VPIRTEGFTLVRLVNNGIAFFQTEFSIFMHAKKGYGMTAVMTIENSQKQKSAIEAVPPCHVFLIEDDIDDRALAKRQLMSSTFVKDVMTFDDGKELTDYMRSHGFMDRSVMLYTPILMLVDLEMPRKDGLEVIRELKSDPFLQPIPLIVLTGSDSRQKLIKAKELGAGGVFRKPLNTDMLRDFFETAWKWPPPELWV
jgi:CheY-like chemotaxis protein